MLYLAMVQVFGCLALLARSDAAGADNVVRPGQNLAWCIVEYGVASLTVAG